MLEHSLKLEKESVARNMTNNLLNEAKTEGYEILVLHASEIGYPLYKNIGFKKYYKTNIYKKSNF